jgi:hypothetical protein
MKFIKANITTLLFIVVAILLTLQVESCFHNSKPNSEYKKEIADKDKQIEDVTKDRDVARGKYDSVIHLLTLKDTVLIKEFHNNTVKYEKIPDNIRNLSNEDLRRSVWAY